MSESAFGTLDGVDVAGSPVELDLPPAPHPVFLGNALRGDVRRGDQRDQARDVVTREGVLLQSASRLGGEAAAPVGGGDAVGDLQFPRAVDLLPQEPAPSDETRFRLEDRSVEPGPDRGVLLGDAWEIGRDALPPLLE